MELPENTFINEERDEEPGLHSDNTFSTEINPHAQTANSSIRVRQTHIEDLSASRQRAWIYTNSVEALNKVAPELVNSLQHSSTIQLPPVSSPFLSTDKLDIQKLSIDEVEAKVIIDEKHSTAIPIVSNELKSSSLVTIHRHTYINAGVAVITSPKSDVNVSALTTHLKNYYQKYDNKINRIFGDPLDLSNCFVNLAIVKNEEQKQNEKDKLKTHPDRTKIYSSYEDIYSTKEKEVILARDLFNERNDKVPRRIAVIGRAGIGKSTLSQYLSAYEWAIKNHWQDKFDAVIKIQLRNLTRENDHKNPTLADIVSIECSDSSRTTKILDTADIEETLRAISNRILIILDGWDEFNLKESPYAKTIMDLMKNPDLSIIVLSRPYTNLNPKDFDLLLECIGFTTENISEYVNRVCEDKAHAQLIISFLKRNPAIHSLAHVPIILDMICAVWDEKMRTRMEPMTMTQLYSKMIAKLWEAYMEKQEKLYPGIDEDKLQQKKEKAKEFLSLLAYMAMERNTILLSYQVIEKAIKIIYRCSDEDIERKFKEVLAAGFLHTSDNKTLRGDYYFAHLTIQEYFAALHWSSGFINKRNDISNKAKEFFIDNKYNPTYILIWRFVSGFLSDDSQTFLQFVNLINEKPIDLTHIRQCILLMNSIEESSLNLEYNIQKEVIQTIKSYIKEAIIKQDNSWISAFSPHLRTCQIFLNDNILHAMVIDLLSNRDDQIKIAALDFARFINIDIIRYKKLILELLESKNDKILIAVCSLLVIIPSIPQEVILKCIKLLSHNNDEIESLIHITFELMNVPQFSLDFMLILIELLNDDAKIINDIAGSLLRKISKPDNVNLKLGELLLKKDYKNTKIILDILSDVKIFPIKMLPMIFKFSNENKEYAHANLIILANRQICSLSNNDIAIIKEMVADKNENLRVEAVWVLSNVADLDEHVNNLFIKLLHDDNIKIVSIAVDRLCKLNSINEEMQNQITLLRQDKLERVRLVAYMVMINERMPPDKNFAEWILCIQDKSEKIQAFAKKSISLIQFTHENIEILFNIIRKSDDEVKDNINEILEGHDEYPVVLMSLVIPYLKDDDEAIAYAASTIIGKMSPIPVEVFDILESLSSSEQAKHRQAAAWVFSEINTIPDKFQSLIIRLSHDKEDKVKYAGVNASLSISLPSNVVADRMIELLDDKDEEYRRIASEFIQNQEDQFVYILPKLLKSIVNHDTSKESLINHILNRLNSVSISFLSEILSLINFNHKSLWKLLHKIVSLVKDITVDESKPYILMLNHADGLLHQVAAKVLGKVEAPTIELVLEILTSKNSYDFTLQESIGNLLNKIEKITVDKFALITPLITHHCWYVKKQIPKILSKISPKTEIVYQCIFALFKNDDKQLRNIAADAFIPSDIHPPHVLHRLIELARDETSQEYFPALISLSKIRESSAMVALFEILKTNNLYKFYFICDLLIKMQPFPFEALPCIINKLETNDNDLKSFIIELLCKSLTEKPINNFMRINPYYEPRKTIKFQLFLYATDTNYSINAVCQLFSMLESKTIEVKENAFKILDHCRFESLTVIQALISLVKNNNVFMTKLILKYLTKLSPVPDEELIFIENQIKSECLETRLYLAERIFKIRPLSSKQLIMAVELLKDKDSNVKKMVLNSFCKLYVDKDKKKDRFYSLLWSLRRHETENLTEHCLPILIEIFDQSTVSSDKIIVDALNDIQVFSIESLPYLLNIGKSTNQKIKNKVAASILKIKPFTGDVLLLYYIYSMTCLELERDRFYNTRIDFSCITLKHFISLNTFAFDHRLNELIEKMIEVYTIRDLLDAFKSSPSPNLVFAIKIKSYQINTAIYINNDGIICFYDNAELIRIKLDSNQSTIFQQYINDSSCITVNIDLINRYIDEKSDYLNVPLKSNTMISPAI